MIGFFIHKQYNYLTMKKIFFGFLTILVLASCSKSHIDFEQPGEISLAPVAHNRTKAMLSGNDFPDEQFNVWAFYKQVDANTSIANWQANSKTQTIYIEDKPFEKEGTNWAGVTPYYWPKLGSLMFAGYYPTSIKGKVTYSFTASENVMTITDYTPGMVTGNTTHEEDVMYFNMTPKSVASGTVSVIFNHALSWISVILAKADGTPADAKITVNSVKFTNVLPTGTATINNSSLSWTPSGTAVALEVCPDDDPLTTGVKENEVVLSIGNTEALAKQPIVIPQDMDGDMIIEYTIASTDGSSFTETKTIALNTMKDDSSNTLSSWDAGKHYVYTITIGTSEILIAPTVVDWSPVPVSIPIQ